MNPPVTVVLTCFNHEATIAEAVGSALAQVPAPARVVVVDDGSRDASGEVLGRLAAGHAAGPRRPTTELTVIRQANAGVCEARNRGAAGCPTELLMFLDGDDALLPGYLRRTGWVLRSRPGVAFAYTTFRWRGGRSGVHASMPWRAGLLSMGNWVHNAALMRTAAFRRVGGFDARWNRRGWEDWALWLAMAGAGMRGVLVDEPLLLVTAGAGIHRNAMAERDAALQRDILAAHPPAVRPGSAAWWAGKALRRAWLTARRWGAG